MKVRLYRRKTFPNNSEQNLVKKLKFLRSDGVDHVDMKLSAEQLMAIEKCHLFAIAPWYYNVSTSSFACTSGIQRHKILRAIFNAYRQEKKSIVITKDNYGKEDFQILNQFGIEHHIIKYRIFL